MGAQHHSQVTPVLCVTPVWRVTGCSYVCALVANTTVSSGVVEVDDSSYTASMRLLIFSLNTSNLVAEFTLLFPAAVRKRQRTKKHDGVERDIPPTTVDVQYSSDKVTWLVSVTVAPGLMVQVPSMGDNAELCNGVYVYRLVWSAEAFPTCALSIADIDSLPSR
jgi:hypothetical protein